MSARDSWGNPLDGCPDCGCLKLKRAQRCKPCSHKARIGERRTATPSKSAGWYRARVARPLGPCEYPGCTENGRDRHHIDGDPLNNDIANIAVYCRRHHMMVDGRLDELAARAHRAGRLGGRPRRAAA